MQNKPKYQRPKILLLDMEDECGNKLRAAGYNVEGGTLGCAYQTNRSDEAHPIPDAPGLRFLEEKEVIFINCSRVFHPAMTEPTALPGIPRVLQKGENGRIDPRPYNMSLFQKYFDNILARGGVIIGLMSDHYELNYFTGSCQHLKVYRQLSSTASFHNLSFSTATNNLRHRNSSGTEVTYSDPVFAPVLSKALDSTSYEIVFSKGYGQELYPIGVNRFGETVAARLEDPEIELGFIILLPKIANFSRVIVEFVEDGLTALAPHLFPYAEKSHWIHSDECEPPEIRQVQRDLQQAEQKYRVEAEKLKGRITELREANQAWYQLLRGTGRELVIAVISILKDLGFSEIVDCDATTEDQSDLREDIQILDQSPAIVVDVKGVAGHPEDGECSQATKHAYLRVKEWNRTDVISLTIINHQRNLPPHKRDPLGFNKNQIEVAKRMDCCLITTIDLAILWRNAKSLNWPHAVVKDLFYTKGKIYPIPTHYHPLGEIVKVWKKNGTFGIRPTRELSRTQRLALRRDFDYLEFTAESLQVKGETVEIAAADSDCGIATSAEITFKEGETIYLVEDLKNEPAELIPPLD